MKTRIAASIASLLVASLGTTAFAQGVQQTPPPPAQQTSPQQPFPSQQSSPRQQADAPMSSAKVKHEVKNALTRDGVTATKVVVAFDNGTVTLTGSVFSRKDIAKAKEAAMNVPGVTAVDVSGLHAQKG